MSELAHPGVEPVEASGDGAAESGPGPRAVAGVAGAGAGLAVGEVVAVTAEGMKIHPPTNPDGTLQGEYSHHGAPPMVEANLAQGVTIAGLGVAGCVAAVAAYNKFFGRRA